MEKGIKFKHKNAKFPLQIDKIQTIKGLFSTVQEV